ncbi:DUF6151 family protein [Algiphilus aromaticivorans]|uniref:DUF6151 family protein n=1 Tax=Algiphilus aromaticivorans TaxID=382454 RepID=UPI0005C26489|nr:DUF6151 family protein [Algiphilus aromaticivorans]
METALRIRCDCGKLQGIFRGVAAGSGNRTVCYCRDCQAFARFLERPDVLDAHGGTEVFQHSPRGLVFTEGTAQLACVRLSDKGMLRWYAACCRTPIANTMPASAMPFVGLISAAWDAEGDTLLGPVRNRIQAQSAIGDTGDLEASQGVPLPVFVRVLWLLIKARLRGDHRHSPFFDAATGQPRARPQVLSPEARRALEGPEAH